MINVTKRNGSLEPYNVEKIKNCIKYACDGLDVNPLALESAFDKNLYDKITTKKINKNLIHHAKTMASPIEPDWVYVAGRLETMELWADTGSYDIPFVNFVKKQIKDDIWKHPAFLKYTDEELFTIGTFINKNNDLNHSYASIGTAKSKYLMTNECIQHMFIGNAMIIASIETENRLDFLKDVYNALSERKLSLATPFLSNLRGNGNVSSCFIIEPDDDLGSIFDNIKHAAVISKNGGGVGISLSRLRASGSMIKKVYGRAGGIIGWNKLFNDTAIYVDQEGKRAGSFTMALAVWHGDIEEFLQCQSEVGDLRRKAFDIKPQVVVNDLFMTLKDSSDAEWYTFCPYEVKVKMGIELYALYDKEFTEAYYKCVEAKQKNILKVGQVYKAKDLFKLMMKMQFETGMPYVTFFDELNRNNPNKHIGHIPCFNLCVAPETLILTDKGHLPIFSLENQKVNVWNGEEWSEVTVKKTGENQELLRIVTDYSGFIDCTPYHHFYVATNYHGGVLRKSAHELKIGDKLIKFDLPIIEGDKELVHAYDNGLFSAEGSYARNKATIYLYHDKRKLLDNLSSVTSFSHDENQNRTTCTTLNLKDKFFVPSCSYTIESRLKWLAGLLDGDGCVVRNGQNEALQLASIHYNFLIEIMLMLQTLGVSSKVSLCREDGYRELPSNNGTGESALYYCNKLYRLLISSSSLFKLITLGFKTNRLKFDHRLPSRNAEQFVTVNEIQWNNRISDTYCFNEPKRHMGVFNGILTGQCTESTSVVVPDKYAHTCNLLSLVLGRIPVNELSKYAALATKILDYGIDLTNSPIAISQEHNKQFRTIGVGQQGLHDILAREYKNYNDLDFIAEISERIQYGCVMQSIELAKKLGKYPFYEGSEWDNGNLIKKYVANSVTDLDWSSAQGLLDLYGIRNSQLSSPPPNTSSSIFMDAAAGIMPVYSAFFYEENKDGLLPVSSMYLKENPLSYSKDVTKHDPVHLTKVVGKIQDWVDTGVSAEYVMDKNLDNFKAINLWNVIDNAWKNKNKAVYYIRTIKKGEKLIKGDAGCVGCAG